MTLLSRKADYALLILSHLYESESGGSARGISEKFGISRACVANILKELCQKGFVASHRGVKGGFSLARPADSVSLAELLESLEDGFRLTMCSEEDHDCGFGSTCTVKGPMAAVHRRIMDVLNGVTLAEIFDPAAPKPFGLNVISNGGCCSNKMAIAN